MTDPVQTHLNLLRWFAARGSGPHIQAYEMLLAQCIELSRRVPEAAKFEWPRFVGWAEVQDRIHLAKLTGAAVAARWWYFSEWHAAQQPIAETA